MFHQKTPKHPPAALTNEVGFPAAFFFEIWATRKVATMHKQQNIAVPDGSGRFLGSSLGNLPTIKDQFGKFRFVRLR